MNKDSYKMRIFFALIFILFSVPVFSQSHPSLVKLKEEVKKLSEDPILKYGQVGFSFRSSDGNIIYESNANKSLIPASNLKLLTTASALKILGENFKFVTKISYSGEIKNGVLDGNIYIEGGGDPTLGSDRYPDYPKMDQLISIWVQKIKDAGVKRINGAVVGDQSIFDKNLIPEQWIWSDIGNYYGAGVSGLNINENLFKIVFKSGKSIGDSTSIIRTEPAIPGLIFENKVLTAAAGSGDNAYIYGSSYSSQRYISGTIPMGEEFSIKGSIPDPAFFASYLLYTGLTNSSIEVAVKPASSFGSKDPGDKAQRKNIYTHQSPPLKEIIKSTNVSSINLYAESLLRIIAVKKGLSGTADNGISAITQYWKGLGLETGGMFLYDGCGLSPRTAIRANQFTKLMQLMSKDSVFKSFLQSLPIAGQTGTVSKFCKGTKAEGMLFLKSGSINRVICYTGYVKSKNGNYNSFSILVNNFECPSSQVINRLEKVALLLTEF